MKNSLFLLVSLVCISATSHNELLKSDRGYSKIAQLPAALADYQYSPPVGWKTTPYSDGIVIASTNGENCNITLWPMRQASGNLQNDAAALFREVFKTFEGRTSSTQPSIAKGVSPQGWNYFIIRQPIGKPGVEYPVMFGFSFVAQLGNKLAAITAISKDPLVSSCFGLQMTDVWPAFFYSLRFKNWRAPAGENPMLKQIPGVWMSVTGSAGDRFAFAANGRYAGAAAAQRYYQVSSTSLLRVTDAFFGDGAYSVNNNGITLIADNDKSNPETGLVRIEQESKDIGRTWSTKMYLLRKSRVDGAMYEVCYDRQNN